MKRAVTLMTLIAALALLSQAQSRGMRAPAARPMARGIPARAPVVRAPIVSTHPGVVINRGRGFRPGFNNFGPRSSFQFFSPNSCDPFVFPCGSLVSPNGVVFRGRGFQRGFSPFFGGGFSPFFGYGYGVPIFADYPDNADYQQNAQPAPPQVEVIAVPMNAVSGNAAASDVQPGPEKQTAAAPAPQPERELPAAVLVLRDQSRVEVKNFAIVGDTLIEFLPNARKRIPLSDIDLPATIRENDARGIDFHVPPAKKGS